MSKEKKVKIETPAPFSFDSIGDIHASIQEESPLPNEQAIAAQSQASVEKADATSGITDITGATFDSQLHATNADGEPSKTPLGKFRKRRGASKVSTTNQGIIDAQKLEQDRVAARAAGQLAADLMVGSAVTLLGDEWVPIGADGTQKPMQFDEHTNLRRAFGDYFEAKGIHDFPPGIMLSIAVSSYAMPRLVAGKETQTRLMRVKLWAGEKMRKLRSKKDATQPDSGDNGERKNDAGETTMRSESDTGTRNPRA